METEKEEVSRLNTTQLGGLTTKQCSVFVGEMYKREPQQNTISRNTRAVGESQLKPDLLPKFIMAARGK